MAESEIQHLMADNDRPDVAALAALFTVNRLLADSMDRALRAVSGLSTAQVEVLVELVKAPDQRMRMADIARAVCVSRSGTTQIVDRLVAAGHVDRVVGAEDRRVVWVGITDAGREIARLTRPVFDEEAARHLGERLSRAEAVALRDVLARILAQR